MLTEFAGKVGVHANALTRDVSRIRGYLRLIKDHVKHYLTVD